MLREETDSESCLTDSHNRELNTIDMHSFVHHDPRDQSRDDFMLHKHWHNSTRVANDEMSFGLQDVPKILIVLSHFLSSLDSLLASQDVQLGKRSSRLDWVYAAGIGEEIAHVSDHLDQFLVLAADETDVCAEGLASCTTENHVVEFIQVLLFPST